MVCNIMQKFILVTLFRNISTVTAVNETYSYYVESKGGGAENCPFSSKPQCFKKPRRKSFVLHPNFSIAQYIFDTIIMTVVEEVFLTIFAHKSK